MRNKKTQWKNQFQQIPGQSKLHERVREILSSDRWFKNFRCFQEVPVAALVPDYQGSNMHAIDWYIEELAVVLEIHGEQHYKLTNRGNIPADAAREKFFSGKCRDNLKKTALEEAGFEYREIHFREARKLTAESLKKIILEG